MLEIRPQIEAHLRQARIHADTLDEMLFSIGIKPKMRTSFENALEGYRVYGCYRGDGDSYQVEISLAKVTLYAVENKLDFFFSIAFRRPNEDNSGYIYEEAMNGLLSYTGPSFDIIGSGRMTKAEFEKIVANSIPENWGWTSHT